MRQWTTPGKWYRDMAAIVGGQQQFNYDGNRTDEQFPAFYQISFPNYWRIRAFNIYHPTTEDDRLTRGGPIVKRTGYDLGDFEVSTDARGRAVFNLITQFGAWHRWRAHAHVHASSPASRSSRWRACSSVFRRAIPATRTPRST